MEQSPWNPSILQGLRPTPTTATISDNELESGLVDAEVSTLSWEERKLRQEQLEELAITDPVLYEDYILSGDLTNEEPNPDERND
jgi:hypothetical protein